MTKREAGRIHGFTSRSAIIDLPILLARKVLLWLRKSVVDIPGTCSPILVVSAARRSTTKYQDQSNDHERD